MKIILGHHRAAALSPFWWLQASSLSIGVGNPVSLWQDSSTSGFDVAQSDATHQPILSNSYNAVSGLFDGPFHVVRFQPADAAPFQQEYLVGGNWGALDNFGATTFYFVARTDNGVSIAEKRNNTYPNNAGWEFTGNIKTEIDQDFSDGANTYTDTSYRGADYYHLFVWKFVSLTEWHLYIDSVEDASFVANFSTYGTPTTFTTSNTVLVGGIRGTPISGLSGEIAEIRAYTGAHDDTTRNTVENALNAIYSLW